MFCFSSEYQNTISKMFKIPDFDDDVPKTDINYNKNSSTPYGKLTQRCKKAGTKHKTKLKGNKNGNTANNSIVKAKDRIQNTTKYKVPKDEEVNNPSINSYGIKEKDKNKSKKNKHKPNKVESLNKVNKQNCPKTNESVEYSNKNNNKIQNKICNEPSLECLEIDNPQAQYKKKKQTNKSEEFDEQLLKVGKNKFNESFRKDDQEAQMLFKFHKPLTKKEKLKNMLMIGQSSRRNHINVNSHDLRDRMLEKLRSAQFRYLNEKLYTSTGKEAQELFQSDPEAFRTYHKGYQQQLRKWPVNPLSVIVKRIKSLPKTHVIADMGCGDAVLATLVPHAVHSFDLVASAPRVTACDMARTPLPPAAVDAAVYCLALMGTELTQYLVEANRILKVGGLLLIAEVESRFDSVEAFARGVAQLGFAPAPASAALDREHAHSVFHFLEFRKTREPPAKRAKLPQLTLKPCIYKRR